MGGHYNVGGISTVQQPDGSVVQLTPDQIRRSLMALDDKALKSIIDGLDPQGGSVSAEVVALAVAEKKRRDSAPPGSIVPGGGLPALGPPKGSGLGKVVLVVGGIAGVLWLGSKIFGGRDEGDE